MPETIVGQFLGCFGNYSGTLYSSLAEHVLLAAKAANQSDKEPEIVLNEDENRKITAGEALKKLDEVKNFIEVNGSNHLNMIFKDSCQNVEQMKLKKKTKNKVILEVSLNLKIHFIYTVIV